MAFLKPLNDSVKEKKIWAFDIETKGQKNKFVMGSIVGDRGIKEVFWDKKYFFDFLMRKERLFRDGVIVATNLNFDFMGLISDTSLMNRFKPIIRNSQMLSATLESDRSKRHKIKFIDSWNFSKISVENMGKIIGLNKLNTPKCFKRDPRTEEEKEELKNYNLRDSEITYLFMKKLQDGFNSLNANLKMTVSSTAMDLFRRNYQDRIFYQPSKDILSYLYAGYYGGRTEAIKRGHVTNLNYYDVNSLYPSVMMNEYPETSRFTYSKIIKHDTIEQYEGVANVIITAPDLYIPYLPLRHDNKLIFPKGTFRGTYTFFELRKALSLGYTIDKFNDGIIYFRKFYPFREYVEKLYALRQEYKKDNDSREMIVKLMMNSLYGKFAQKIDKKEVIVHKDNVTMQMLNSTDNVFRSGDFFIFNDPYDKIPAFVNPIFSIYTTAYARDRLYDYMRNRQKDVYYFDTDSLFIKGSLDVSHRLGEMKLEMQIKDGIIVKPKMYIADDYVKCKGLFKMDRNSFCNLLTTKTAHMERFVKFKEANKRGLEYNEIIEFDKILDLEDNKRKWYDKFNPDMLQDSEALAMVL